MTSWHGKDLSATYNLAQVVCQHGSHLVSIWKMIPMFQCWYQHGMYQQNMSRNGVDRIALR